MVGAWNVFSGQSEICHGDSTQVPDSLQPGVDLDLCGVPCHRTSRRAAILHHPLGYMEAGGCILDGASSSQVPDTEEATRRLACLAANAKGGLVDRDHMAPVGERNHHVCVLILALRVEAGEGSGAEIHVVRLSMYVPSRMEFTPSIRIIQPSRGASSAQQHIPSLTVTSQISDGLDILSMLKGEGGLACT